MIQLLEDHSPYYAKFDFPNRAKLVEFCRSLGWSRDKLRKCSVNSPSFYVYSQTEEECAYIFSLLPKVRELGLNINHAYFMVLENIQPLAVHRDSFNIQFSLNVGLNIEDEVCTTSWYADDAGTILLEEMVLHQNECVLFNTSIPHGVENKLSNNTRVVLSVRNPSSPRSQISYANAFHILFECEWCSSSI